MPVKCSQCGIESEIEQAFTRKHRWLGLQTRFYCPAYRAQRHVRELTISLASWGLVAVGGLAFALFAPAPFNRAGQLLLQVVLIFLLTILMILPHELAHALAGRLLGLRVFAILIGFGKTLYARRIGGILWEARALPFGGFTVMGSPPLRLARLRMFLTTLAGPTVHALVLPPLIVVQILLAVLLPHVALLRSLMGLLVWANLLSLAGALFPAKSASVYGEVFTDGWRLLRIPFLSSTELHKHFGITSRRQLTHAGGAISTLPSSGSRRASRCTRTIHSCSMAAGAFCFTGKSSRRPGRRLSRCSSRTTT